VDQVPYLLPDCEKYISLSDRAGIDRIRAGVVCRFLQESCPEEKKAELDGKISEFLGNY
jgi:hypothetical protein